MKTFYSGVGLIFAGLMITGGLLSFFDIIPVDFVLLIAESNIEIKIIALSGLALIAAGFFLLTFWMFFG